MEKMSTVFVFVFLTICGVACVENTTYYDEHPEQHKYEMQVYGVSSETSVERYPVEKIKYGNREKCEATNLTSFASPSSLGRLYPVHKSGQSFLVWLNDSNYIMVDVSQNCSSLLLENINMVLNQMINVTYLKGFLELCQNGIVIRNKLCDPYITYNTRLISNFIPYFSDVKIYFIDEDNLCTARFSTFVETYNNVITNKDIYRFLTNLTSCWDNVYFTNQLSIEFSLQSIHNKHNIVRAVLTTHTYKVDVFFILKYQTCKEQFIQYVYSNGLRVSKNDTFHLSIDNLMILTDENTCFEVYLGCNAWSRYAEPGVFLPHSTISYITSAVALIVLLVNGFVLFIFLQKGNRTPVTILLSALAISDSTTAVMMTVPILILKTKNGHHVDYSVTVPRWYLFDISECLMNMLFHNLAFGFHFVSILLTTLLSLQKTVVLLFPMWSKYNISNRSSVVCSILIFIFCFSIFSAIISVFKPIFLEPINGRCCIDLEYSDHGFEVYVYLNNIVNGCTILACLVVALCTIYIICKLTILRRNLPWTDNSIVQKRHRTSAISVVAICIICLLSEATSVVRTFAYVLSRLNIINAWELFTRLTNYRNITIIIGCSLNFVIYLVMGRKMRDKLRIGLVKIGQSFKRS